jgi:NADH dehydrogenase/NADH:ubiquinone oxidoreductase subunit G
MSDLAEEDLSTEDQIKAPDEGLSDSQGGEAPEARARRMGWKPQEEYKGKDEWVDAETFIKKTEEEVPHLRKALKNTERTIQKLEKGMDAVLAHQSRQLEDASKQAYAQAIKDIETRLGKAIEDGDTEAITKSIKARDELRDQQLKAKKPVEQPRGEPAEVADWKARNTWFQDDPVLADAAARYTDILASQGKSIIEQLEGAEKYVKETFPFKFRQPKDAPAMPGGGNNVARNTKPKPGSYEALTSEAKAECDRTVKGSNGKISKEDWLKYASPDMFRS